MRVKEYQATFRDVRTNKLVTESRKFTEAHAREIGAVLEVDGINIVSAQNLMRRWNRMTALKNHYKLVDTV